MSNIKIILYTVNLIFAHLSLHIAIFRHNFESEDIFQTFFLNILYPEHIEDADISSHHF